MSISKYEALRPQVEAAVHRSYASLMEYSRSDKANLKAIYARRTTLDTFADGWNAAENEIEILRDQIDILKAKLKQANAPPKKEKDLSIYSVIRCFKHSDPVLLQHVEQKRKQHLEQKQMEWEDHF